MTKDPLCKRKIKLIKQFDSVCGNPMVCFSHQPLQFYKFAKSVLLSSLMVYGYPTVTFPLINLLNLLSLTSFKPLWCT